MVDIASNWLQKTKNLLDRYDILFALFVVLAVTFIGTFFGWYNNKLIPLSPNSIYHYSSSNPLKFLSNWDGPDYISIAKHGLQTRNSSSFFPLYPLLIKGFSYLFRSYLISAILLSWASFVGAVYFYLKIAEALGLIKNSYNKLQVVLPYVLFPTGVFLFATYSESLLSMLAFGSVYFSLRRRYVLSGFLLMFATTAHVTAVLIFALDLLIIWEDKQPLKNMAIITAGAVAGLSAYLSYLFIRFHDALAFMQSQTKVHGWLGGHYLQMLTTTNLLNVVFAALLIAAAFFYWTRRKSLAIFCLLFLAIPIIGAQWGGFNRYVILAFPVPLMFYEVLKNRIQLYACFIPLTAIFWAYTLFQYAGGYIGS